MLIGSVCQSVVERFAIHRSSFHWYSDSLITEPVAGGTSVANAIGSALSRRCPSGVVMANLYTSPTPTPGMKTSHTPAPPMERIGYWAPFHMQKSPMTATPFAFGAHTVNDVPETSPRSVSYVTGWAPMTSHRRSWRPSPIRCRSASPMVGRKR